MIASLLSGQLWKIMTSLAGVASLFLGYQLARSYFENRELIKASAVLDDRINNPKTGFTIMLAQSRTNSANMAVVIEQRNRTILAQSIADRAKLEFATATLATVQEENRKQASKMKIYLALPPKGSTLEEQILDIDARFMESLK